ncbi:MAG: hypothetical protein HY658_05695 [Actinobacteria bacterium]|nr:hypothetical protein [Actinomycetota bacterium]
MDEQLEFGFTTAVFVLDHVAEKVPADEADREFTDVAKENFWRMWPHVRAWAEELWGLVDEERADAARPAEGDDFEELGGG